MMFNKKHSQKPELINVIDIHLRKLLTINLH